MTEWIYGRRTVAEHLAAAPTTCRRLLAARGTRLPPELRARVADLGLLVEEVPRARLDGLARGGNHQGVCLEVGGWTYVEPEALVARAGEPGRLPVILTLDCVQDPRNLGAVLRVADGAGAAGVIVPADRAAGLSAAVARTAAGALAGVPVARVVNLARALDDLKDQGFAVVGAAGEAKTDLYAAEVGFPCVVVFGGEHRGLRPNVGRRCDTFVSLPMTGVVTSLNVAVAAGVVCYELLRRRGRAAGFSLDTPGGVG